MSEHDYVQVIVDGWVADLCFDSWDDDWSHGIKPLDYVARCNHMYQGIHGARLVRAKKGEQAKDLKGYMKAFGI